MFLKFLAKVMNFIMKTQVLTITALALILIGCGAGSGEGLDENGQPTTNAPPIANEMSMGTLDTDASNMNTSDQEEPNTETPEPESFDLQTLELEGEDTSPTTNAISLAQLQDDIFTPFCASCHTGGGAPQGLRLDSIENTFADLVDVDSQEIPSLRLVAIGDPDNSYLVHKVEGRSTIVGSRMPLGQPPLASESIQAIRDWITAGATRANEDPNSTQLVSAKGGLTANQFAVQFNMNRALNSGSVSTADIRVEYVYENHSIFEDNITATFIENELVINTELDLQLGDPKEIRVSILSITDQQGHDIDGDNNGFDGGVLQYVYINP